MNDSDIRCVFCWTTTGKRSGEHVLRRWFKGRIGTYPAVQLHRTSNLVGQVERLMPITPFDQVVNDVCRECNQGWLEQLEGAVGNFLVEFANARIDTFPADIAESLALWCVTRGLLRAQMDNAALQHPDLDSFHEVWQTRKPPRGARVHASRCDAYVRAGGANTSRCALIRDRATGAIDRIPGSVVNVVSFGLGALFFQVSIPGSSTEARATANRFMDGAEATYPDRFTRLWPYPNVGQPTQLMTAYEARSCTNLPALLGEAKYTPQDFDLDEWPRA
jgi:hypothetical protein